MSLLLLIDSIQQVKAEVQNSAEFELKSLFSSLCEVALDSKKVSSNNKEVSALLRESISQLIANPENKAEILSPINKALEILKAEFNPSSVRTSK